MSSNNLLERRTGSAKSAPSRGVISEATGDSRLSPAKVPAGTPISALTHTANARDLVTRVDDLNTDIRKTHSEALVNELSVRIQQRAKTSPHSLLETLGGMGFSWRAVAQLVNVSVPALQKWRKGEGVSGENRLKIATLLAGIDVIASQLKVQEIDSWFETPLVNGVPVTPISIWSSGEYVLVLRYASEELSAEAALDAHDPAWRTKWETNFEAGKASDGHVSLSMKG